MCVRRESRERERGICFEKAQFGKDVNLSGWVLGGTKVQYICRNR